MMRGIRAAGRILTAGALLLGASLGVSRPPLDAAPKVVYEERFDAAPEGATAADLGWTEQAAPDESEYVVEKGALRITCLHKPYRGGSIDREVPKLPRGRLEFDATLGDANNFHLSLIVSVYGIKTSFHGYGSARINWNRYSAALEATGAPWAGLASRVTPETPHHFAIEFDADAPRVEYFVDDMDDPVFIDTSIPVLTDEPGTLLIGNYGLCSGTVVCRVDNIRLLEGGADGGTAAGERCPIVVDGYGFGLYRVDEALARAGLPEAKHYRMDLGLGLQPKNATRLARLIGSRSLAGAGVFILANVTAECLGPELIGGLDEWVRQGGTLLVLGGYFTFGKGGFRQTPLEAMLPVSVAGPWEVRRAETPLALRPGPDWPGGPALDWAAKPVVLCYHDLKPKPGSLVLLQAGEVPVLMVWPHGQGKVAAFTGATAGKAPPGTVPFWRWSDWPALLGAALRGLGGQP